ncbi:hypothetical protein IC582_004243 [Cucumis melo]
MFLSLVLLIFLIYKLVKQPALSFINSASLCDKSFGLIHSDIWGPTPCTNIYFLKNCSSLYQIYVDFANMVHTQFSSTIKILRTDSAMEYKDSRFLSFIAQQGALIQCSCPHTSQQNRRAEHKHCHILNSVLAQLLSASCSENFWREATFTSIYVINCFLLKSYTMFVPLNDYTILPLLTLISKYLVVHALCYYILMNIPNLNLVLVYVVSWVMALNINVFIVGIPSLNDYVFLAMSPFGNIVCFIVFLHFRPLYLVLTHSSLIRLLIYSPLLIHHPTLHLVLHSHLSSLSLTLSLRSRILHVPLVRNLNLHMFGDPPGKRNFFTSQRLPLFSTIMSLIELSSYKEASTNPLWQQAMNEELQTLKKTHTWDYVDLPPRKKPIDCHWIFKIKTYSNGTIEQFKAQLVA